MSIAQPRRRLDPGKHRISVSPRKLLVPIPEPSRRIIGRYITAAVIHSFQSNAQGYDLAVLGLPRDDMTGDPLELVYVAAHELIIKPDLAELAKNEPVARRRLP